MPIEAIRSISMIRETGSITRAANRLGLSQPAISAQVKRIEAIVGGNIFEKTPHGSALTELGKLVLLQAQKMLEANDQLIYLRRASSNRNAVRIGICELYTKEILACLPATDRSNLTIYADSSAEICKALATGHVDIAVFFVTADEPLSSAIRVVSGSEKELVWVRSRDFVLSPGSPIPLITWPGQVGYLRMLEALQNNGMIYRLAFTSPDIQSAYDACAAGIGVLAMVRDFVPNTLMIANEYYLAPFKPVRLLLGIRSGSQLTKGDLIDRLSNYLIPQAKPEFIAPQKLI